ncbi:hypothetical protein PHYPSEUDO_009837 [Phytophthora pseudosyringae]|uniref:Uncharacterized protein n=1 Tax=Phytophthora pseudosyringae TaxID=221518 RepID=A0A8T1W8N2_9STRA|nr:hypothetical protein PHYPSEUDO_009837 [Phytophthora pseudosyringae]
MLERAERHEEDIPGSIAAFFSATHVPVAFDVRIHSLPEPLKFVGCEVGELENSITAFGPQAQLVEGCHGTRGGAIVVVGIASVPGDDDLNNLSFASFITLENVSD